MVVLLVVDEVVLVVEGDWTGIEFGVEEEEEVVEGEAEWEFKFDDTFAFEFEEEDWLEEEIAKFGNKGDGNSIWFIACDGINVLASFGPIEVCSAIVKLKRGGKGLPSGRHVFGSLNSSKNGCAQISTGFNLEDGS